MSGRGVLPEAPACRRHPRLDPRQYAAGGASPRFRSAVCRAVCRAARRQRVSPLRTLSLTSIVCRPLERERSARWLATFQQFEEYRTRPCRPCSAVLISMTGCDDVSPTSYESTNVVVVLLDFSLGRQPVRNIASERATFTLPEEIGSLPNCLLVTLRRHRDFLLPNIAFILRSILLFLGQLSGSRLDSNQGSWTDMAELYRTRCPGARGDRLSPGWAKALLSRVSSSDAGLPKRRWLPWSPRPMRGVAAGAWMLPESSTSWAQTLICPPLTLPDLTMISSPMAGAYCNSSVTMLQGRQTRYPVLPQKRRSAGFAAALPRLSVFRRELSEKLPTARQGWKSAGRLLDRVLHIARDVVQIALRLVDLAFRAKPIIADRLADGLRALRSW